MENVKKVWIISSEPARTDYGSDEFSTNEYVFKEEVDVHKLQMMITEFSDNINESLEGIEQKKSKFQIDTIEINATMAVDGKIGILGSSVGAKAEGGIKFVFKRNE